MGICRWKDNVNEVERRLTSIIPRERWTKSHHQLIFFGRYHCLARKPKCDVCPLFDDCREGQKRYRASLRASGVLTLFFFQFNKMRSIYLSENLSCAKASFNAVSINSKL